MLLADRRLLHRAPDLLPQVSAHHLPAPRLPREFATVIPEAQRTPLHPLAAVGRPLGPGERSNRCSLATSLPASRLHAQGRLPWGEGAEEHKTGDAEG
jgi:hypothetical protein